MRVQTPALTLLALIASACSASAPLVEVTAAPSPVPTVAEPTVAEPTIEVPEESAAAVEVAPSPTPAETIAATAGADGLGDTYYEQLGNGGYDVERYVLDLEWEPESGTLSGTVSIEAAATKDLSAFNLDFVGMEVSEIAVDGAPASFSRTATELTIELPEPIGSGSAFETAVTYSGQPGSGPFVDGVEAGGWYVDNQTAFVVSEPAGSRAWHPVNDHPRDKALYRVEMTAPSDLTVVSGGILVDTIDEGDGTSTWVYEPRDPMAPYLLPLAIGDLEIVEEAPAGDVVIRNAFARGLTGQAETFNKTAEMIGVFSELFGPYPFEAYGVLVLDSRFGLALEQQTLSLFGQDFFGRGDRFDDVVAHELAHQWFGDHVTVEQWSDIWLNEGFATYAPHLYFEATDPAYDIDAELGLLTQFDPSVLSNPPPGDPGGDDLFAASVYFRGALTLHALRRTIGDDAFFDTLRTYVERFGGANATTEDFLAVAQEVSEQDLEVFFDEWLYQTALPEIPESQ